MSENKLDHLADVLADIGRTPKGARFLNRLLYWWPKATTVHDDKAWIYRNGREEWASEIGVPLRRFEWLVTMFRADDLIETRAYQLVNNKGRSWGTKVQHVRPSDRLLRIIKERTGRTIGGPEVPASGGANDGSPTAQPPSALQAPSATSCGESPQHVADLYNKDTTYPSSKTNNEIDKKEGAPVPGDALTSPKKEKYLGENINKEGYPPTPLALDPTKPTGKKWVGVLIPVWQQVMAEVEPGGYHGMFSAGQKGMLGQFIAACPKGGYAGNVLTSVLKDWIGFTNKAENDAGAFKTPGKPTPEFLLKHVAVAVAFWMDKAKLVWTDNGVQPTSQTPPKSQPSTPTKVKVFVDMEYDPPCSRRTMIGEAAWNALSPGQRAHHNEQYAPELQKYDAEYTAKTGKQPPADYAVATDELEKAKPVASGGEVGLA